MERHLSSLFNIFFYFNLFAAVRSTDLTYSYICAVITVNNYELVKIKDTPTIADVPKGIIVDFFSYVLYSTHMHIYKALQ